MKLETETIKRLTKPCRLTRRLYRRSFPRHERLPFRVFMRYAGLPGCSFTAFYDGADYIGAAYVLETQELVYLLYLAVDPAMRGRGYGRSIVSQIRDAHPGKAMVLDLEPPNEKAPNALERRRRIEFYEKLGFRCSSYEITDATGDYRVMTDAESFDPDSFKKTWGLIPPCFEGARLVKVSEASEQ